MESILLSDSNNNKSIDLIRNNLVNIDLMKMLPSDVDVVAKTDENNHNNNLNNDDENNKNENLNENKKEISNETILNEPSTPVQLIYSNDLRKYSENLNTPVNTTPNNKNILANGGTKTGSNGPVSGSGGGGSGGGRLSAIRNWLKQNRWRKKDKQTTPTLPQANSAIPQATNKQDSNFNSNTIDTKINGKSKNKNKLKKLNSDFTISKTGLNTNTTPTTTITSSTTNGSSNENAKLINSNNDINNDNNCTTPKLSRIPMPNAIDSIISPLKNLTNDNNTTNTKPNESISNATTNNNNNNNNNNCNKNSQSSTENSNGILKSLNQNLNSNFF